MKRVFTVVVTLLLSVANSEAVILAGGDGTQNTSPPAGGQGWDYVGRITSANNAPSSVTFISNNWFITTYHIQALDNPTGVLLGGASYSIDLNSWKRLKNSSNGNADLAMFRVIGDAVDLPGLTIRVAPTMNGSGLTMIGNGRNRETSETYWRVDTSSDPYTWTEEGNDRRADLRGYKWASGSTKRWGTNTKEDDFSPISIGYGATDVYYTDFDDAGGDEAQGATYDSGGGVFYENDGALELAGIMVAVAGFNGQPVSTSVYGNRTYIADMQYYAAQINAVAQIDDLDEDGIPDEWEYEKSGSSIGVDAVGDQDGDGFSGEEEWIADTDPSDVLSFLRFGPYTNAVELVFESSINREYQVQYGTSLSNLNWQVEIDWFAAVGTQTVALVDGSASNRFFRIRARLP